MEIMRPIAIPYNTENNSFASILVPDEATRESVIAALLKEMGFETTFIN
jgi:hypothetical protein